jgi:hypothetical protein
LPRSGGCGGRRSKPRRSWPDRKNLEKYGKQAEAQWTRAMSLPAETVEEWACRELAPPVGYSDEEVIGLLEQLEEIAAERGLKPSLWRR